LFRDFRFYLVVTKGQWSDYENGKKKEYGEFVRRAKEFVYSTGEAPWEANPANRGQPAKNDPRALVICLLLKIWLGKPYRDIVPFISDSTYLWPIMGLRTLPGRMDLQRAMNRLTREYLAHLNRFVVEQGYYSKKETRRSESVPLIAPASRSDGS
jgi:hypothetical protein